MKEPRKADKITVTEGPMVIQITQPESPADTDSK